MLVTRDWIHSFEGTVFMISNSGMKYAVLQWKEMISDAKRKQE
jgi:hypothetical protein